MFINLFTLTQLGIKFQLILDSKILKNNDSLPSLSTQMLVVFFLLINVKMPTMLASIINCLLS